ncbi:MAG: hypothetical protein ACRDPA_03655, partial [Solirubrobacteraceae bacterium]
MTARHILGVLDGEDCSLWRTFDCAVALAGADHATLVLAKTTDPGRMIRWLGPVALHSMAISPEDLDFRRLASHTLARMTEFVPAEIPVTTRVLAQNTADALIALIRHGCFDTLVAGEAIVSRRRLQSELRRLGLRAIVPPGTASPAPGARSSP